MVYNILDKVKSMPRILQRKIQPVHNDNNDNRSRVISTYGCDKVLVDIVENASKMLKSSKMFCRSNLGNPYKFTKRVGLSLKSLLCNSNRVCIGPTFGITSPCGKARCQSCKLMSNKRSIILNGQKFQTAPGNCTFSIVLYAGVCVFNSCKSHYTGKTTQPMNERINGHRSDLKKYFEKQGALDANNDTDRYGIGIDLYTRLLRLL